VPRIPKHIEFQLHTTTTAAAAATPASTLRETCDKCKLDYNGSGGHL